MYLAGFERTTTYLAHGTVIGGNLTSPPCDERKDDGATDSSPRSHHMHVCHHNFCVAVWAFILIICYSRSNFPCCESKTAEYPFPHHQKDCPYRLVSYAATPSPSMRIRLDRPAITSLAAVVRKKCNIVSLVLLLFGISNAYSLLSSSSIFTSTSKVANAHCRIQQQRKSRSFQPFSSAVCYVSEQDNSVNHGRSEQNLDQSDNGDDRSFRRDDPDDGLKDMEDSDDDGHDEDDDDQERQHVGSLSAFALENLTERLLNGNNSDGIPQGRWTADDFEQLQVVMRGWLRQKCIPGSTLPAIRQEQLVRRVVEEKLASNPLAWSVNMRDLYNMVITSWSKTPERGAPQRAEEILDAMQHSYNTGQDEGLKPTLRTWNRVLKGYCQTQSAEAPREVIRVLSKLDTLYKEGKTDVQPSCDSYFFLLRAHAAVGGIGAAENVLALIQKMEKLAEEGFPSIKPDTRCHNVYLRALVETIDDHRVSAPEVARKAEAYLRKMAADPVDSAHPDHWSYNAVLTAWSNSGDIELASRGESLIKEMESSENGAPSPTIYEYNTLLTCYAWSSLPDKAERALALWKRIKEGSLEDPKLVPDTVSYNSVAACLIKSKYPDAATEVEALLDELTRHYKETGDSSFKPSNRSYNICVRIHGDVSRVWLQHKLIIRHSTARGMGEIR